MLCSIEYFFYFWNSFVNATVHNFWNKNFLPLDSDVILLLHWLYYADIIQYEDATSNTKNNRGRDANNFFISRLSQSQ